MKFILDKTGKEDKGKIAVKHKNVELLPFSAKRLFFRINTSATMKISVDF